jgi:hypothetical protein
MNSTLGWLAPAEANGASRHADWSSRTSVKHESVAAYSPVRVPTHASHRTRMVAPFVLAMCTSPDGPFS